MDGPTAEHRSWSPGESKRGLECRHCGCRRFRVFHTRRGCGGKRMTTWERPIGGVIPAHVLNRGGYGVKSPADAL